jgi:tellurite resistance protein
MSFEPPSRKRPADTAVPEVRIPPNAFGICFGLAGLAEAWGTATETFGTPKAVANVLYVITAVVWIALLFAYCRQGIKRIAADFHDGVVAPFIQLICLVAILLGAALFDYAPTAGRVVVGISIGFALLFGAWLTGQWIVQDLDVNHFHPGYFLPTVAGGLLAAATAAEVGWTAVAETLFGIGVVCWVLVGSILLNRLFFLPRLPPPLIPTWALEIAPPAVGGFAYFAITHGRIDLVSYVFAGYTVLMALVQLRFIPVYASQKFSAAFWAFTFAYAAVIADAIEWLGVKRPPGYAALAGIALALISLLIVWIAVRSVIKLAQGTFFPKAPPV